MAQFLRPNADISNAGSWTTAPLWSKINDSSDSTSIASPTGTNPEATFVVSLDNGSTPSAGTRTVRVRARKNTSGGQNRHLAVRLLTSADVEIATYDSGSINETLTTYSFTVSASISSYSGLRLEISDLRGGGGASRGLVVTNAEFEIPDAAPVSETLTAETGSFAVTGQTNNLLVGRLVQADVGSFAITGQETNFIRGYGVIADVGDYVLTGQTSTLTAQRHLTADEGQYVLTGNDATLSLDIPATLTADTGEFSLVGQDVVLIRGYAIVSDEGTYSITPQEVNFSLDRVLTPQEGVYVLTGNDAGLAVVGEDPILTADVGEFTLTGVSTTLTAQRVLPTSQGTFSIIGEDVGVVAHRLLETSPEDFIITPQESVLKKGFYLQTSQGVFNITDEDVTFTRFKVLSTSQGAYTLTGRSAILFVGDREINSKSNSSLSNIIKI
jgi:hypothetical protein